MGKLNGIPHDSTGYSGPRYDHTHNNLRGSYLYYTYTTDPIMRCVDSQTEIQLESSLLDLRTAANLSFWYVLKGRMIGHLRLFGKNEVLLWDSSVNHTGSEDWTQAIVQLQSGVYRLTFKGSCTLTTQNDIAIDDIALEGEPLDTMTTTQSDETTALPLETSTEAELSRTARPTTRATTHSLETSTAAELSKSKKPTTETTALSSETSTAAELSKSKKPTTRTTALSSETSTAAELSKSKKPTTETTALSSETSTAAELSKSKKPTTETTALSLETSTAAELSKSRTPTTRTTAVSSETSTSAELSKSQKPTTRTTALSLWYMLKGRFASHLDLFGKNGASLWDSSVSHSSSQEWMQASVQQESGVNGLTFKASYKYALYNDIAIDGILLKRKPLDTMTTEQSYRTSVLPEASGGTELRMTKRPTTRTTALSLETSTAADLSKSKKPTTKPTTCCLHTQVSCSFEDGPCGWHSVSDDPQQGWGIWHMKKLAVKLPHDSSRFSGPGDDHTLQNLHGSYLYYTYTTSTPMRCLDSQTEMQLESSLLNLTTAANLSFWYVLRGRAVGHLHLIGKNGLKLWESPVNHSGSQEWTQATIQLESGVYRLTFKASCKYTFHNDIAIDDIVLGGEPLDTMTTT
ncbi:MAM and LDL-receptor class A domain-containing protein 1-like [Lingula anatina]|uniref:MAM and LDL-receptor class A domain-containing protein 1-like n=1 Tax=Lingula anatina TaxID=7574 RepID=A0A1S3JWI4_LINAN|nr:MAM and LDL-receptor class A domain-containing protein 1-like [Lingula anatina]|eukprot:XP_013414426.1 MAM and LDL-receptor class A domain-containing protein 1-like [Lingula anatina]